MRQTTIALLVVLGCVLWASWFFTTHEKVVTEQFTSYQGEARFNNFLAAEMLLSELGIDADSRSLISTSDWLPNHFDTMMVRVTPSIAVENERQVLAAWISTGGHLILLPPEQITDLIDDFLAYFGFRLVEVDQEDEQESGDDEDEESYTYLVDLDRTRYRIELPSDPADWATLSDTLGNVAVRQQWGDGYVSVFANSSYFDNDSIDDSDHARLLLDSVAGHIEPGKVWFIYDSAFPALWRVIWNEAKYAVIGLTSILLLWLWSVVPMFGSKVDAARPERRSITEHVVAAGRFMWRQRGASTLSAASASAVIREAESRHPGIKRLSPDKQAKLIAKMTGRSPQSVLDVLVGGDERRQREFTHDMQLLQNIRREL